MATNNLNTEFDARVLRSNLLKAGLPIRNETVSDGLVNKHSLRQQEMQQKPSIIEVKKNTMQFSTDAAFEKKKKALAKKKEKKAPVVKINKTPSKRKKEPPGIPCYTLQINGKELNPDHDMVTLIGAYIMYPISKVNTIDEVLLSMNIKF